MVLIPYHPAQYLMDGAWRQPEGASEAQIVFISAFGVLDFLRHVVHRTDSSVQCSLHTRKMGVSFAGGHLFAAINPLRTLNIVSDKVDHFRVSWLQILQHGWEGTFPFHNSFAPLFP
jgi:hypothetical protein